MGKVGQSSLGVGYNPHPFSQLLYYIKPTYYIYNTNNKKRYNFNIINKLEKTSDISLCIQIKRFSHGVSCHSHHFYNYNTN